MSHIKITKEKMGKGHALTIEIVLALHPGEDTLDEAQANALSQQIIETATYSLRSRLPKALMKRSK